jgi:hypothetical protein
VISKLKQAGIDVRRDAKVDQKRLKDVLADLKMPSGVPIRKVRVLKTDKTIRAIRKRKSETFVKPGSTHHLSIFEWEEKGKRKRDAIFLAMLDACIRVKKGLNLIEYRPPNGHLDIPSHARFVMSLSTRELILVEREGRTTILVFRSAKSTTKQMSFAEHSDARKSKQIKEFSFYPNTLCGRKVTVDLLGRIRNAGD